MSNKEEKVGEVSQGMMEPKGEICIAYCFPGISWDLEDCDRGEEKMGCPV